MNALALVDPTAENIPLDTLVEEATDALSSGNWLALGFVIAAVGFAIGRVLLRRRSQPKLQAVPDEKPKGLAAVAEVKPADDAVKF